MVGRFNASLSALVIVALASPGHAQSLRSFEADGRLETRAMLGITIPLGGKSTKRNTEPRLDFRFDASRIDSDPFQTRTLNPLLRERRDLRATTLSLTFEQDPKLLLNGSAFASMGSPILSSTEEDAEKEGRSTGEKILRGVGWAGIGAVVLLGGTAAAFFLSCDEVCRQGE